LRRGSSGIALGARNRRIRGFEIGGLREGYRSPSLELRESLPLCRCTGIYLGREGSESSLRPVVPDPGYYMPKCAQLKGVGILSQSLIKIVIHVIHAQ